MHSRDGYLTENICRLHEPKRRPDALRALVTTVAAQLTGKGALPYRRCLDGANHRQV